MLKIYNSFTKDKEAFHPIEPGKIRLYVCGMTVYDFCHIGHARMLLVFDMVVRFLRYSNYDVHYVRNITDIDDKIIRRAQENQEPIDTLTDRFISAMQEDFKSLNLLSPNEEPRATRFIDEIIQMIQALIDKGFAYIGKNGDVFYEIKRFSNYGKLSNRDMTQLRAGARVEVAQAKRDALDFVLWKSAKEGEPSWVSPWGDGRPGWHIECSVMAAHCLGTNIDIHGGGMDLLFPHHENEIAQSEAANEKKFVNTWMHVGFLQFNQEKMAKSLGNIFTIREVLEQFSSEVLRYFMLASHYRSPLNYSEQALEAAKQSLNRLYTALRGANLEEDAVFHDGENEFEARFVEAMNDDFNTPEALAVLFDLARTLNSLKEKEESKFYCLAALLKRLGGVLGLLEHDPNDFLQGVSPSQEQDVQQIEALIQARNEARQNKNWSEADRLRDELSKMGVELEDASSGTVWRRR